MVEKLRDIGIMLIVLCLAIFAGFQVKRFSDKNIQDKAKDSFKEQYLAASMEFTQNGFDDEYISTIACYSAVTGDTIAIIDVPAIDLNVYVVEGIEKDDIANAIGHYPQSAMPWKKGGNFCVAGHSSITHSFLFNNLHDAEVGMEVTVMTKYGVYTYIIEDIYVVEPSDTSVLDLDEQGRNTMTMTTCYNRGKQRLVVKCVMDQQSMKLVNQLQNYETNIIND